MSIAVDLFEGRLVFSVVDSLWGRCYPAVDPI